MTRRMFLEKYLLKFAVVLAMLGLIVYTVGHSVGMRAGELLTTPLRRVSDRQITSVKAYLFRDEEILAASDVGLFDVTVQSGSKIGKNVSVAQAHTTALSGEALEEAQRTLDGINRAIRILEDSLSKAGESLAEADGMRAEAIADYTSICEAVKSGDLSGVAALEEELLRDMNRYLILAGKSEDADEVLERLRAEKTAMLAGSSYTTILNAASSGVFYGTDYVDGYESLFSLEAAQNLTEAGFRELLKTESEPLSANRTVGKMVYGYSWYAAMELPQELIGRLRAGERYDVSFPENGGRTIGLTLERVDGSLAVFRSDDTPTGFVYYRSQSAEITLETRDGYYVPDTALCREGDAEGVYVFENSTAYFRRITVLYRGDGYCIASEESEVRENDILITSGRNLYDGKVYE